MDGDEDDEVNLDDDLNEDEVVDDDDVDDGAPRDPIIKTVKTIVIT